MIVGKLGASLALCLLVSGVAGSAVAQIAPRLTGAIIVGELETAQHALAARASGLPHASLADTSQRLGAMAEALRKSMGGDLDKPIDTVGASDRASAYRAEAAVKRTQAYLDATEGCLDGDATAMAKALAKTVELEAAGSGSSRQLPIINGVETLDKRPLFVLRGSNKPLTFALIGENLLDAQCASPVVTATDGQGKRQSVQPSVSGVLPNRIELKLPDSSQLPAGDYVLHVLTKHKAFLVGCTTQPETTAVVQLAPPVKLSVSYSVTATCRAGHGGVGQVMPAVTGSMPDGVGSGTVSQYIKMDSCSDPLSYAISAKVTFSDGHSGSIGPISQIASAGISAGLPGGLSLSWDPSVRQLLVRPSSNRCKGVY